MPGEVKNRAPRVPSDAARFEFHGVVPGIGRPKSVISGTIISTDLENEQLLQLPTGFDLAGATWREHCQKRASIPAGYTYLAQLMGHDIGRSVPLSIHPAERPESATAASRLAVYNLVESPLSLETIYGTGPVGSPLLFTARTLRFRIGPHEHLARQVDLPGDGEPVALMADPRNRDTPMLHELATAWMRYHNLVAMRLVRRDLPQHHADDHASLNADYLIGIFGRARAIVTATWHAVLREDLLPRLCRPDVMALDESEFADLQPLEPVDTLNGLMRAFHAMPLDRYRLNRDTGVGTPLARLRDRRNEGMWKVDWSLFLPRDDAFAAGAKFNRAALSASYAATFSGATGHIAAADLSSATHAGASPDFTSYLRAANARLPSSARVDLGVETIAAALRPEMESLGLTAMTADEIASAPLFLLLMAEAHLYGSGRFGPVGSLLLRNVVEKSINGLLAQPVPAADVPHRSMIAVIEDVENSQFDNSKEELRTS